MGETLLRQEAEFFDRWANENAKDLQPVDPAVLLRYQRRRRTSPKEFCFGALGDLRGKQVLDVGCGEGEDAMILARFGACVTGLDVSPAAIDLARQRAVINGVESRTSFICAPLDRASLPERSFDVIWIDNVLHHVLDDLEATMAALLASAKPGAAILCIEPVSLNRTLRRIRFLVPVHTEVTPGERPLEKLDLAVIEKLVPGIRCRHFNFLGRLIRFVVPGFRYERAPLWRRWLCDAIRRFDRVFLSLPGLRNLGGIAVLYGTTR